MRIVLVLAFLVGCTNPSAARNALESSGYTHVEMTGAGWFGCGESETVDGFKALNPAGLLVTGKVCCGLLLKGCTVRF